MRIAFLVGGFPTISETFIINQICGLMELGNDVDIFPNKYNKREKTHSQVKEFKMLENTYHVNIPANKFIRVMKAMLLFFLNIYKSPIVVMKSLNIFKYGKVALSLKLFYSTIPFIDKDDYDIYHAHFGPNGNLAVLLKEIGVIKGKIVTSFLGADLSKYLNKNKKNVYEKLLNEVDLCLPINNVFKQKLIDLGCDEKKIVVHHIGIKPEKYNRIIDEEENKFNIITIARLVEKKGVVFGIKAISKLVNKYPNISYKIVGDGYLRNDLENLINEMELNSNIEILGYKTQNEIKELFKNYRILLAPSVTSSDGDKEGIPIAIMEAMASGLCVISTTHSGIPELVRDGKDGFLVPERNTDLLAEKIEILINNKEKRMKFSNNARKRVEKKFNSNYLITRLFDLYKNLI